MELIYDKAALQEYMDDMEDVCGSLRQAQDSSVTAYSECQKKFTRLYSEIEQLAKQAYNRVEDAYSLQRSASSEYNAAVRLLENAEDDSERRAAQEKVRRAQQMQQEADEEMAVATAEYEKAKANLNKIIAVGNKYTSEGDSLVNKIEDGYTSFYKLANDSDSGLGMYMGVMDKVEESLYGDAYSGYSSGGNASATHSSTGTKSPSSNLFITNKGNMFGVLSSTNNESLVMNIAGQKQAYSYTESGLRNACEAALKSGDDELVAQADLVFSTFNARNTSTTSNQQYVEDTLAALGEGLSDTINKETVLASAEMQKMRAPKTETSKGQIKGSWQDSVFYMDESFVPKYGNADKLNVAQIKQQLSENYGIQVEGIPFKNGAADFSSISIATVSAKDIVMKSTGMSEMDYDCMGALERTNKYSAVFKKAKRGSNFTIADKIVAERQIPIRGLEPGYTADDLEEWRKGKFTWDEQVDGGYNLVPTIIHGNISHTGLVSSSDKASKYFEQRKNDSSAKYSWDESDAPITVSEILNKKKTDN